MIFKSPSKVKICFKIGLQFFGPLSYLFCSAMQKRSAILLLLSLLWVTLYMFSVDEVDGEWWSCQKKRFVTSEYSGISAFLKNIRQLLTGIILQSGASF